MEPLNVFIDRLKKNRNRCYSCRKLPMDLH